VKPTFKQGTPCPVCGERFLRLALHLAKSHNRALVECPHCFSENTCRKGGKRKCGDCGKVFTIGLAGKPAGIRPVCPDCYGDFYTEKLGLVKCPTCKKATFIDGKGKPC